MKRFLLLFFGLCSQVWSASVYVGSTNWTAVTAWAAVTSYSVGDLRRQLAAPTVGQERVFRCTTAGLSAAAEPAPWTLTAAGTTNDGTAVWTEVTGLSTYGWTAAHARLANAFAAGWMAAGDTAYVSQAHAETQGSAMTLTSPGTAASTCRVLCANDGATPPTALATTATITTTGTFGITFEGFAYIYGIIFSAATGSGLANLNIATGSTLPAWCSFDSCSLRIATTSAAAGIQMGGSGTAVDDVLVELRNTTMSFGATGQQIKLRCDLTWTNTVSAILGSLPTTLFTGLISNACSVNVTGVDFSALGAGKSLVNTAFAQRMLYRFQDCKLGSSVALTTGAVAGQGGCVVRIINCDSTNTNYRYQYQDFSGTITQETVIVRTGGATDGTTPVSRKMVSTANSKFEAPLVSDWIEFWNETTGSAVTVTIPTVTDNVTLTDAEAWVEVEALTTASFPLGVFAHDRVANILATPTNQTTDGTSTWTTTGLTTPVKQSLSVQVTPQVKGVLRARVCLAKAATTIYFDPKTIAGARQFQTGYSFQNHPAAGGGETSSSFTAKIVYPPGIKPNDYWWSVEASPDLVTSSARPRTVDGDTFVISQGGRTTPP